MSIGARIRQARLASGLSQAQLAKEDSPQACMDSSFQAVALPAAAIPGAKCATA